MCFKNLIPKNPKTLQFVIPLKGGFFILGMHSSTRSFQSTRLTVFWGARQTDKQINTRTWRHGYIAISPASQLSSHYQHTTILFLPFLLRGNIRSAVIRPASTSPSLPLLQTTLLLLPSLLKGKHKMFCD